MERAKGATMLGTARYVVIPLLLWSFAALAQQYPNRPIRMISAFPAGAIADTLARIVAAPMAAALGQPVVVENKVGAEGMIGTDFVAKAAPDGYTLLFTPSSVMTGSPAMRKQPPYDPGRDLTAISMAGYGGLFLLVHPSVPARTVRELVEHARANPGALNYATGNASAVVGTAQLMKATGTQMVHVPYKGEALALPDLLAGRVQVEMFASVGQAMPHIKEGRLRLLASVTDSRSPLAPETPTISEAGVPSVAVRIWAGLFGPPGMPKEIVDRLAREVSSILKRPEVQEQFARNGYALQPTGPAEFGPFVKQQYELWKSAVREAGIALE
jgi:tripartite-type tricarboxylate transporter receptor subunit TctC